MGRSNHIHSDIFFLSVFGSGTEKGLVRVTSNTRLLWGLTREGLGRRGAYIPCPERWLGPLGATFWSDAALELSVK